MDISRPDGRWASASRAVLLALVLAVVVASAGCSSIQGGDGATDPGTAEPTPQVTEAPTESDAPSTTSADEPTTAEEPSETADGPTTNGATGRMTVVVAGDEVTEGTSVDGEQFRLEEGEANTWNASGDVTLADALSTLDVEANQEELTYDGETYSESTEGTAIYVRVNGEAVDPTSYTLSDGDEVWVTVETADMDVDTPGDYIKADHQHVHGQIEFLVDGEEVDFSEDRYQSGHQHFHFEGGHGDPWHAHSWSMTLKYAMDTLQGIEVNEDAITYDGTTYEASDSGTNVTIEVNGEPVTPSEYFLKDGDSVRIEIETDG